MCMGHTRAARTRSAPLQLKLCHFSSSGSRSSARAARVWSSINWSVVMVMVNFKCRIEFWVNARTRHAQARVLTHPRGLRGAGSTLKHARACVIWARSNLHSITNTEYYWHSLIPVIPIFCIYAARATWTVNFCTKKLKTFMIFWNISLPSACV